MPTDRFRRLVQGQGGSTLIELLVAMPIAVLLLGLVIKALGNAGLQQQDIEHRTESTTNAQLGLERLTRELRQSDWVYFRSSSVIDMQVAVRASATGMATPRLVRWDCSTAVCVRWEGNPTTHPPPAAPVFESRSTQIGSPADEFGGRYGRVTGHDVFGPTTVDPETGVRSENWLEPDFMTIRLRLEVDDRGETIELLDGVSLRNRTSYADD